MTKEDAWKLAEHWVAAWNAHDLELILAHYEDGVELTSPVAAQLLGTADGKVVGKANLRAYFQKGLAAYPELQFQLEDVFWGLSSVVLCYKNQKGTRTAEFMELSASGKVARVVANYSATDSSVSQPPSKMFRHFAISLRSWLGCQFLRWRCESHRQVAR